MVTEVAVSPKASPVLILGPAPVFVDLDRIHHACTQLRLCWRDPEDEPTALEFAE
jgi:hypothetical protein